jgi:FG-GAP repeat
MAQYQAVLALSGLDGANGFRVDGASDYDRIGNSVASAGDINGDGFDDLIMGSWGNSPPT